MKISETWLRKWVNPAVDTATMASQLTMAGLEVESIEPAAGDFSGVVVGEILAITPHPKADKLQICEINVGEEFAFDVVCGADNIKANMKVPVALVGAVLAEQLHIQASDIRGVESRGMLCSSAELGLTEEADCILELPEDAQVGDDIHHYLELNDSIIDMDLTPNRGDCLSIAGIARDVGALNDTPVKSIEITPIEPLSKKSLRVDLDAPEGCPRYLGRVMENIDATAITPLWLREALRRAGVRSLSPVVDVTNYVMLELGQPMHAFDLDTLQGSVKVRYAKEGEALTLLDEQSIKMSASDLVIADEERAIALAGIMGGEASAVTQRTKSIFLESAFFHAPLIATRARHHRINTESSHRFERGVDYQLQNRAMERATELLLSIVGGKPGPITVALQDEHLPKRPTLKLRWERMNALLGVVVPHDKVKRIMIQLGMPITDIAEGIEVQVPSFRFDIQREEDLIEEAARVFGYENIPALPLPLKQSAQTPGESRLPVKELRQHLKALGYNEAITYSFVDPKIQALLDPDVAMIPLANPISANLAVMRSHLWPGLLEALAHNQRRQASRVRFYEIGPRYNLLKQEVMQEKVVSGFIYGQQVPEQWGSDKENVDFFSLKGDMESLFRLTNLSKNYTFNAAEHPALQPGQTAKVSCDGEVIGIMGGLHPNILEKLGLHGPVYLFELQLEPLTVRAIPHYSASSKFPSIRRDIAILLDESISARSIVDRIEEKSDSLVRDVQIFDVYQGKGVEIGKKSLALTLTIQHPSRNLIESEINQLVDDIVRDLNQMFQATLR